MYNSRRQEVAVKLPPAPQTMLQYVWQKCLEAGVAIDVDDFSFVIRAAVDYLNATGEGKRVMLKLLRSTTKEGSYQKQYYQSGHLGDEEKQLDYRGLVEYSGWIYMGKAVPHDAVDIWDKPDLEACEMCGGLFPKTHCLITVKTFSNGREHLENMCNHCRLMVEDMRVKETASHKTCESCEMIACRYNPKRQQDFKNEMIAAKPQTETESLSSAGIRGLPATEVIKKAPSPGSRYGAF